MDKVMITVAPIAATNTSIDPKKIAKDVFRCYQQGASMVHLHVRDAHGKLTANMSLLEETVNLIQKDSDIVIEISTGGVSNLTIEERCQPCYAPYVEATSLNVGSVNLGESVYRNPIKEVRYCVQEILENKKFPEIEIFELGMIQTVKELAEEFLFSKPMLFALVFGHGGTMPAELPALQHMVSYLYEKFPEKKEVLWGYTEAHRTDWVMVKNALAMGASTLRIGFEDSDYLDPEYRVKTNAPLIARAASIVREMGKEPMTPAEVRNMMGFS